MCNLHNSQGDFLKALFVYDLNYFCLMFTCDLLYVWPEKATSLLLPFSLSHAYDTLWRAAKIILANCYEQ